MFLDNNPFSFLDVVFVFWAGGLVLVSLFALLSQLSQFTGKGACSQREQFGFVDDAFKRGCGAPYPVGVRVTVDNG